MPASVHAATPAAAEQAHAARPLGGWALCWHWVHCHCCRQHHPCWQGPVCQPGGPPPVPLQRNLLSTSACSAGTRATTALFTKKRIACRLAGLAGCIAGLSCKSLHSLAVLASRAHAQLCPHLHCQQHLAPLHPGASWPGSRCWPALPQAALRLLDAVMRLQRQRRPASCTGRTLLHLPQRCPAGCVSGLGH